MKNTFFILLALLVFSVPARADDDRKPPKDEQPVDILPVDILPVEELPFTALVPIHMDEMPEEELVRCWRGRAERLQLMQYGMIVGLVLDLSIYSVYVGATLVMSDYAECKVKKAIRKRRAE